MTQATRTSTLAEVAAALRSADKVALATHENPDGDAIGSVRAAQLVLHAAGISDVVVYVPRAMVPREYEFIRPERLTGDVPADIAERTLLCLDCGNESRLANDEILSGAASVLNVDHHADNTCYGAVNVVRGLASCTTQLVFELAAELDVEIDADIATAIYVGLVTDTGRFQYSNTNAEAFRLAADLVDAGVDVHDVFREVYERVEYPRLKLLAKGLENARRYDNGRLIVTCVTRADFAAADAADDDSEGIVDFLRGVEGTHLAVFVRELPTGAPLARKGSLRTTRDDVDVSAIARTWRGGGHRQAAGFSTDDDMETIVARVREALAEQMPSANGHNGS
jgi:phosphoesterase RecJ-like protein